MHNLICTPQQEERCLPFGLVRFVMITSCITIRGSTSYPNISEGTNTLETIH